uniref:Uncharacterized protein n=1 Tax=Glossina palpalis gambiensis TaxID=67801 RepID=A0A1B0B4J8_9MUSC
MNSIHRNCMNLMSVIDSILYESNTHLACGNISAGLYPNRLEVDICRSFFAALVTEHPKEEPWPAIYSATNVLLRKIYFFLIEVVVVGIMTLMIMYVYNIKWIWSEKEEIGASERSLKTEKAELIKPVVRLEQIVTPDGNSILLLKMSYKRSLPNSDTSNKMQNSRSLPSLHDTHPQTKHKTKGEISKKFIRLFAKQPSKRITFDERCIYKEYLSTSTLRFSFSPGASNRPCQRSYERNSLLASSKNQTTTPSMLPVCVARRSKQKQKQKT